jgi:ribosome-associated protein
LEQLSILATRKRSSVVRLNRNSKIFKTIIQAIQDKKAQNIISLDLRKIPEAVADFFIICEAGSTTQVKAVADSVEEEVKNNCEELPFKHEGRASMQWVLIDYVNVVVHVMLPENRRFYQLEDMWSDAPQEKYGD